MDLKICEEKTKELMNTYIPEWTFRFDNAVRRFGCCRHGKKVISLSRTLSEINDWETVKLTVLHEIAHALVGVGHGHDWVWQKKCIEIGGDGKRCYDSAKVNTPTLAYTATCPNCGEVHQKARKPKRRLACAVCSGTFEERELFFVKAGEQRLTIKPRAVANNPKPTAYPIKGNDGQFEFTW